MSYITSSKIIDILEEAGAPIQSAMIADSDFKVPTKKWFTGDFSTSLSKFFKSLKLVNSKGNWVYVSQTNDCDNAATGAGFFAQVLMFQTSLSQPDKQTFALPVGEFWFNLDNEKGRHAIIFAIVSKSLKLVFMEPQTRKEITLSKNEIKSCTYYRCG
jgi:hypothetical protein